MLGGQIGVTQAAARTVPVMRKALLIVLVLVVIAIGAAFYLGWFSVSTSHDPEAGRSGIHFVMDQNKIQADFQKAKDKIAGAASSAQ